MGLVRRTTDGLKNLISGLGTEKDKTIFNQFVSRELGQVDLENMYRSDWIARKAVDLPAFDMTREWRRWQTTAANIEALETAERRHKVQQTFQWALTLGRLYGGALIIMGVKDSGDSETPLDPSKVQKDSLEFLTVLHRHQVKTNDYDRNPLSSTYGQPPFYEIDTEDGKNLKIHPSRCILIRPHRRPDDFQRKEVWGDSTIQSMYDALVNASSTQAHSSGLVAEAKLDIIKVKDLAAHLATKEGEQALFSRFTIANVGKSTINTLLLDLDGEEWERKEISFNGINDLLKTLLNIVSGAAEIPATRMLGISPAGQNATGESDLNNYYDMISSRQKIWLSPILYTFDEVFIRSTLGSIPPKLWFLFPNLKKPTATEKSEIDKRRAETTKIYFDTGLFGNEVMYRAVANQLIEEGVYPGLEEELAKDEAHAKVRLAELGEGEPQDPNSSGLGGPGRPEPAS